MTRNAADEPPGMSARGFGSLWRTAGIRRAAVNAWLPFATSIRMRLAMLVLIAAVPLLILSATIAWQNYRLALDASRQSVQRLREAAVARHASAITSAEQILQAMSQIADWPATDVAQCTSLLASVLKVQRQRYSNLAVYDPQGALHCSAQPLSPAVRTAIQHADDGQIARARASKGFTLGAVRDSLVTGQRIIPTFYPILRNHQVTGFLYAGLLIDWFVDSEGHALGNLDSVWLVDGADHVTQVASTGPLGLPQPAALSGLLRRPGAVDAASAGGAPYAYASGSLGYGYRILVAYPASQDRASALMLLWKRLAQLALLLLLGLAAVAVGTHVALVEPLNQLSRAVAKWRGGGVFEADSLGDAPTELRALAASFAEATQGLADQAKRARIAVEQQELLIKEIHHRVKNNLQIVASLLNLQASRIRLPEARAEFASARDRVRALATVHRHLYSQGEVHTINMRSFLTELCDQLFQAMGEREGHRIKLSIEASELQMSSDQAVPLSLIVTEAVTNALKYAFPGGRSGHVDVTLVSDGEEAELAIRDDGVGMPAGREEQSETGPRDGIGIQLIRGFARQVGATLSVQEAGGTAYVLKLPLRREVEMEETVE